MAISYIGYLASALVLCTFLTRTMVPLRIVALGSNVAFIAYGALLHLSPVLVLRVILLPVNAWRLREIFQLVKSMARGCRGIMQQRPPQWRCLAACGICGYSHGHAR